MKKGSGGGAKAGFTINLFLQRRDSSPTGAARIDPQPRCTAKLVQSSLAAAELGCHPDGNVFSRHNLSTRDHTSSAGFFHRKIDRQGSSPAGFNRLQPEILPSNSTAAGRNCTKADLSPGATTSSNSCGSSATRPSVAAAAKEEEFGRDTNSGWDCAASSSGLCDSPPATAKIVNDAKPPKGRFENLLRRITPNPVALPGLSQLQLHSSADHLLLSTKRSSDGGEAKGIGTADDYRKYLRPQPASRSKSSSVYGSLSTAVTESFRGLSSRVHKVKSGNLVDRPNSCDFDNLLARDSLVSPRINDNLIPTADRESGFTGKVGCSQTATTTPLSNIRDCSSGSNGVVQQSKAGRPVKHSEPPPPYESIHRRTPPVSQPSSPAVAMDNGQPHHQVVSPLRLENYDRSPAVSNRTETGQQQIQSARFNYAANSSPTGDVLVAGGVYLGPPAQPPPFGSQSARDATRKKQSPPTTCRLASDRGGLPLSKSIPQALMLMHRSTSNLDMQAVHQSRRYSGIERTGQYGDARRPSQTQMAPLAALREYGSTSSIDVIAKEIKSHRPFDVFAHFNSNKEEPSGSNEDSAKKSAQKTTPKSEKPGGKNSVNFTVDTRGPVFKEASSSKPSLTSKLSVKEKSKPNRTKSLANDSIFRKLIGGGTAKAENPDSIQPDGNSGDGGSKRAREKLEATDSGLMEASTEEKLRRKIFAHYDVQSIVSDTSKVSERHINGAAGGNTTTGASAASRGRVLSPQGSEESSTSPCSGEASMAVAEQNGLADMGDQKTSDLLQSCPFFRNELGNEPTRLISLCKETETGWIESTGPQLPAENVESWIRPPVAAEVSVLENLSGIYLGGMLCAKRIDTPMIEHVDSGAFFYRHCFAGKAHQNFFGMDDQLGPVAISLIRDRLDPTEAQQAGLTSAVIYRAIVRLSDLTTYRGSILEESLPSYQSVRQAQLGGNMSPADFQNSAGTVGVTGGESPASVTKLPIRELLELVVPELQLSCLRIAVPLPRTEELLLKLDEQSVSVRYKVGILYCKAGQNTEEQMYNNETSGPAFDEFLDMLGQRVRLKGFDKYKGGLDTKGDSTGQVSLYTTFEQYEVMFHVSTMLPFTASNKQQLSRKRHIGNDIVTIIFQEPGALPFTPQTIRSHFQHVFVVVRAEAPNTDNISYRVAVSRSKDVPTFGPQIPQGATFPKSKAFRDFILTKVINAENAVHKSEKFVMMSARTRKEYLKDLAENHSTSHCLPESSASSKLTSKLLGKKKDRLKPKLILNYAVKGAIVWEVFTEDFSLCRPVDALLAVSADNIVVIEQCSRDVIFNTRTHSVIGWTCHGHSVKIYYDHGDVVWLRMADEDSEGEMTEVLSRLRAVTKGCDTVELTLRRSANGQLGFHIQHEGIVSDVEMYGAAWQAGLRQGSRLVEICKVTTSTLSHDKMLELLKTTPTVRVLVIPPLEDGSPRRGCADPYCSAILTSDSPFIEYLPTAEPTRVSQPRKPSGSQQGSQPLSNQRSGPQSFERASFRRQAMRNQLQTSQPGNGELTSPEARVIPADHGYESGNNLSSKSLDELDSTIRHSTDRSGELRSNSADQDFFINSSKSDSSAGVSGYHTNTMSSGSSEDRWYSTPQSSRCTNDPSRQKLTDTLSSNDSTGSSDLSTELAGRLGDPRVYLRPNELKRRVEVSTSCNLNGHVDNGNHLNCGDSSSPIPSAEGFELAPTLPPRTYKNQRTDLLEFHPEMTNNMYKARSEDSLGPSSTLYRRSKLQSLANSQVAHQLSSVMPKSILATALPSNVAEFYHSGGGSDDQWGSDVAWPHLVTLASRAVADGTGRPISNATSTSDLAMSYSLKLQAAHQQIRSLQDQLHRAQDELAKERSLRHGTEVENLDLREANRRLDEERLNAELELQRFTEWFFKAVDSNFAAVGGPPMPPGVIRPPSGIGGGGENNRSKTNCSQKH